MEALLVFIAAPLALLGGGACIVSAINDLAWLKQNEPGPHHRYTPDPVTVEILP